MIHEVGSWQHFVKRQDNLGLPIMEVKQKYLKEMNSSPIDLNSGGSRTVTSTPAPMIYVYNFQQCCARTPITLYTTSSPIIVGSVLYTNIGLTTPYNNVNSYALLTECPPDYVRFNNAIIVNTSGVVTSTTYGEECGN